MIALECHLNGTKIATAGGNDVGLLLAILTWCLDEDEANGERADIEICGQRDHHHLVWKNVRLQRGDEVVLRLVDVGAIDVDQPAERLIP